MKWIVATVLDELLGSPTNAVGGGSPAQDTAMVRGPTAIDFYPTITEQAILIDGQPGATVTRRSMPRAPIASLQYDEGDSR